MARKKVSLVYIAKKSARKAALKKRKKTLIKKVSELSTLCGVDACAIIFSPHDSTPDVWPSNLEVKRVLERFEKMTDEEQHKKRVNQESFTRKRFVKEEDLLRKQEKKNRQKEMTRAMHHCLDGGGFHHMNILDLNDLGCLVSQNIKEIKRRIELFEKDGLSQGKSMINGKERGENSLDDQMASKDEN